MGKGQTYRLADSTVVEPLIYQWSAWAHLIPPVAASLHLVNYQIPAMLSYLENPETHVKACRDPNLIGGPFIDIPADEAHGVRALLESMQQRLSENIKLAKSITEFHNRLVDEAKGQSLEPYYQRIPGPMRGYVELVYDYYNRPTVRFIEGLLYESPYYDKGLQSLRVSRLSSDYRPFIISTPRLMKDDQIDWAVPFNDPRVDDLFRLDVQARPLDAICELLGLDPSSSDRVLPLLSDEPVGSPERWDESAVRIRYFGHACVLVEWNGVSVLTDPYIGATAAEGEVDHFSYRDLPERIDYVVVTHNHHDHFAPETLLRLRHRVGCLVVPRTYGILYGDASLKLMAQKLGFENVVELDSLESVQLPGGEIIAVPFLGEHSDVGHGKNGFVIRAGKQQMLFIADSNCLDEQIYENLRRSLGPIETVFMGMECVGAPLSWHCGPLLPHKPQHEHDQTRRSKGCDCESGLKLLKAVGANRVYNYAMGLEPWLDHLLGLRLSPDSPQIRESNKLLANARAQGFLAAERLFGKREIYLDGPGYSHLSPETGDVNDREDQFVF